MLGQNPQTQEAFHRSVWEATFPNRKVTTVLLSKTCEGEGSEDVDVALVIWTNYRKDWQNYISSSRLELKPDADRQSKDLVLFDDKSIVVPHVKSRAPFMVRITPRIYIFQSAPAYLFCIQMGLHGEASSGRNKIYHAIVDTKAVDLHRGGPTLYWPLASRYFWDSDGYLNAFSPDDLLAKPPSSKNEYRRRRGIAFLFRQCDKSFYSFDVTARVNLFDFLKASDLDVTGKSQCACHAPLREPNLTIHDTNSPGAVPQGLIEPNSFASFFSIKATSRIC